MPGSTEECMVIIAENDLLGLIYLFPKNIYKALWREENAANSREIKHIFPSIDIITDIIIVTQITKL